MASALEVISREHLECAICCEKYKHPRLLPCLHSFCVECLQSYVKDTTTDVACPTCRQTFPVPDGGDVTQFPTNYPLSNLVEAIDAKQKELLEEEEDVTDDEVATTTVRVKRCKTTCDSCGQEGTVTVARCIDCHHYLCQFCKEAHLRVLAFQGHDIIDIASHVGPTRGEMAAKRHQIRQLQQQLRSCSQHPSEEARYFCLRCNVMICSDCAVTQHRTSGHDVVTLKEAAKNRKEYLRQKTIEILGIAEKIDQQDEDENNPRVEDSEETVGKGEVLQSSKRARNACRIVEQALEQSSDDDSEFLVLFATLDTMMQQIYEEFIEAGYLDQQSNRGISSTPLLDALGSLFIGGVQRPSHHVPPQMPLFPHRWRRHFPPPSGAPPSSGNGTPTTNHPMGPFPFGPHQRPPWFCPPGPRHPHHGPPHHRRGRGRCHARRK